MCYRHSPSNHHHHHFACFLSTISSALTPSRRGAIIIIRIGSLLHPPLSDLCVVKIHTLIMNDDDDDDQRRLLGWPRTLNYPPLTRETSEGKREGLGAPILSITNQLALIISSLFVFWCCWFVLSPSMPFSLHLDFHTQTHTQTINQHHQGCTINILILIAIQISIMVSLFFTFKSTREEDRVHHVLFLPCLGSRSVSSIIDQSINQSIINEFDWRTLGEAVRGGQKQQQERASNL